MNELLIVAAESLIYLVPVALAFLWVCGKTGRTRIDDRLELVPGSPVAGGKSCAVFACVTIVVALCVSYGLGALYSHPAPYMVGHETLLVEAPENAFPSQHTTVVFAFAIAVFSFLDRTTGLVALVFAGLVGFGRWYVGVHYPIDIAGGIGGALLGLLLVRTGAPLVHRFVDGCIAFEHAIGSKILRND